MTKRDGLLIVGVLGLIASTTALVWRFAGEMPALATAVILLASAILGTLAEVYRKTRASLGEVQATIASQMQTHYNQTEALLSIMATLQPTLPLPPTRGWAGSPDFLKLVSESIFKDQPRRIVELGSGVSTLIAAYSLKRSGVDGTILSLDHDATYAAATNQMLARHGLQDIARVVHAPLTCLQVHGDTWRWYDLSKADLRGPVDFLIIDGPPGATQKLARYPALPLLRRYLSDHAVAILDDANRADEQAIAARWSKEFSTFEYEWLPLEKGALVIRGKTHAAATPSSFDAQRPIDRLAERIVP